MVFPRVQAWEMVNIMMGKVKKFCGEKIRNFGLDIFNLSCDAKCLKECMEYGSSVKIKCQDEESLYICHAY